MGKKTTQKENENFYLLQTKRWKLLLNYLRSGLSGFFSHYCTLQIMLWAIDMSHFLKLNCIRSNSLAGRDNKSTYYSPKAFYSLLLLKTTGPPNQILLHSTTRYQGMCRANYNTTKYILSWICLVFTGIWLFGALLYCAVGSSSVWLSVFSAAGGAGSRSSGHRSEKREKWLMCSEESIKKMSLKDKRRLTCSSKVVLRQEL